MVIGAESNICITCTIPHIRPRSFISGSRRRHASIASGGPGGCHGHMVTWSHGHMVTWKHAVGNHWKQPALPAHGQAWGVGWRGTGLRPPPERRSAWRPSSIIVQLLSRGWRRGPAMGRGLEHPVIAGRQPRTARRPAGGAPWWSRHQPMVRWMIRSGCLALGSNIRNMSDHASKPERTAARSGQRPRLSRLESGRGVRGQQNRHRMGWDRADSVKHDPFKAGALQTRAGNASPRPLT